MMIRPAERADAATWECMRAALWPPERPSRTRDGTPADDAEHAREIAAYFEGGLPTLAECLLAFDDAGRVIGFAELSIRAYASGCRSGRVAYLEGWYVEPDVRRQGVGAALVRAAEDWGRAQGCTEFGSDTHLDNAVSETAHRNLGFTEVGRAIEFRKSL